MLSHVLSELLCVATAAPNGSDGKWEGSLTWHIVAPTVLTMLSPSGYTADVLKVAPNFLILLAFVRLT